MKNIIIEKTKNIYNLEFKIPTNEGVYLLVGPNGAGKTTLLICLDRICNSLAFASGFTNTGSWDKADQFTNAGITYQIGDNSFKFRKKKARWVSTPKRGAKDFLKCYGYSESIFIRADSKRIDVKADDLREGNLIAADQEVKNTLNFLFETNRYDELMRLRNANGRGRQATYFYVIKDGATFYSEKRFSTGELALVRLVEKIYAASDNALILLDEAELALHPRVQVNLLEYLNHKADEKKLTIIVSTHSPAMIKAVSKENIFLLKKKNENEMEIITPCYPATAMGGIEFERATVFDYIFFVEDDIARSVLKHILNRYITIEPSHATAMCNIIPVGGYVQTSEMAINTKRRVFAQSKVYAVVDQDAFEDLDNKPVFRELISNYTDVIKGFGFTPENWLIRQFENASDTLKEKVRNEFRIEITSVLSDTEYRRCSSPKPRQLAKKKFDVAVDILSEASGNSKEVTIDSIIKLITWGMPEGQIKGLLNPMFR